MKTTYRKKFMQIFILVKRLQKEKGNSSNLQPADKLSISSDKRGEPARGHSPFACCFLVTSKPQCHQLFVLGSKAKWPIEHIMIPCCNQSRSSALTVNGKRKKSWIIYKEKLFGFTSSQLTSEDLGVGGAQMIPRLTLPVSTHLYAPNWHFPLSGFYKTFSFSYMKFLLDKMFVKV